jgi:hypothetical protein
MLHCETVFAAAKGTGADMVGASLLEFKTQQGENFSRSFQSLNIHFVSILFVTFPCPNVHDMTS